MKTICLPILAGIAIFGGAGAFWFVVARWTGLLYTVLVAACAAYCFYRSTKNP